MDNNGKDLAAELRRVTVEWELKEQAYKDLPKDKLIDRLIMCEMEIDELYKESLRKNEGEALWYYVGDKTGAKYISDQKPEHYYYCDSVKLYSAKQDYKIEQSDIEEMYVSNGEVNIRIPNGMEKMFPALKYGDAPIKIRMDISF